MAYERINWQNEPSEATALNDVNLNKMDSAIYELDGKATTTETAITNLQDGKVDKVNGKGLSQVDNVTVTQHVAYGTVVSTIKTYKQDGTEVTSQVCNGIVVDSALSDSSTNPVQNKVVKSAIDEKSTVAISDTLATGTTLANITIDGTTTAIKGSDIEVDEELSPTSTNPVENKAIYDALNNLLPSKTVSGNPIAISDASGFNAKALTVSMNPIQDLHGYDHPWAGGAGKNKLPFDIAEIISNNQGGTWSGNIYTYRGITFTPDSEGRWKATGTATEATFIRVGKFKPSSGSYLINGITGGSGTTYRIRYRIGDNSSQNMYEGDSNIITVDGDTEILFDLYVSANYTADITFEPMIRLSTVTDATFAPYSNICPISGRMEASVVRKGVNQWDEEWETGSLNANTGEPVTDNTRVRSKNFISINPNTQYYALPNMQVLGYDRNYSFVEILKSSITGETFTTRNCYYIKFRTPNTYGGTYNNDLAINYPATDTAYHAYTAETHTHQYSETIYGGSDDFVNGGAKSEYHSRNCDGTEDWQTNGSSGVYIRPTVLSPNAKSKGNALMSIYKKVSDGEAPPNGCWNWNSAGTAIQIRDERAMTASAFKTLIATDNNLQICYELATPTTIQTSAEEITLLKGNNVLSTNADDMELKYSVSLDSLLTT